jgi:hypothetical protein
MFFIIGHILIAVTVNNAFFCDVTPYVLNITFNIILKHMLGHAVVQLFEALLY